jgi:uncharacterized protein (TIGR00369 family)
MVSDPSLFDVGLLQALGFRPVRVTADEVVIEWDVADEHRQPYGIVHGGVYSAAAETAASVAGTIWLGERGRVVGVSNQTDFLRAVEHGRLTARATPVHRGRSQQLWQIDTVDESDRLVARSTVRLQNLTS